MEKITNTIGKPHIDYRASKVSMVKPKIAREYLEDGVRFYATTCGRIFIADTYDKNFLTPKGKIAHKRYKGKLASGRII